jgi:hypothetical protein
MTMEILPFSNRQIKNWYNCCNAFECPLFVCIFYLASYWLGICTFHLNFHCSTIPMAKFKTEFYCFHFGRLTCRIICTCSYGWSWTLLLARYFACVFTKSEIRQSIFCGVTEQIPAIWWQIPWFTHSHASDEPSSDRVLSSCAFEGSRGLLLPQMPHLTFRHDRWQVMSTWPALKSVHTSCSCKQCALQHLYGILIVRTDLPLIKRKVKQSQNIPWRSRGSGGIAPTHSWPRH